MTQGNAVVAGRPMMPPLGFGTWQLKGDDAYRAVSLALEAGYRHLDTATLYGNEDAVGKALAVGGLPRDEVFVTTKFAQRSPGREPEALARSLDRLGLERVDLWLLHYPLKDPGENAAVWDAFLAAADEGLATDVGVSNHSLDQLDALTAATGRTPAVNQIRLNPPLYDPAVVEGHHDRQVVLEGHSPLRPRKPGLAHPAVVEIAAAHGATPAQVVLAWQLAHRIPAIPRSGHPERILENFHATDLDLTPGDIARIDALGKARTRP
ncbi:aldo/keto reductase [Streptomyces roseoverticillatus]|uniref:aldo/keto reductase n=1 Tax=Streptomyces roseoverticillatus TaxID=66429 RepID=UPI0004BF6365|nr:aldo/keto reductase [Streptomyces roseoverticillatus]